MPPKNQTLVGNFDYNVVIDKARAQYQQGMLSQDQWARIHRICQGKLSPGKK